MKHRAMLWPLLLLLPGLAAAACGDGANEGLGPVMIRSESPAAALRLTPMPRDPYLLCAGEKQFQAMVNLVTIWSKNDAPPAYLFDLQMLDTHIALDGGLAGGWAYEFSYDDRRPVEVGLNHLVTTFHRAVGIGNDGRDQVPYDETVISIPSYGVYLNGHNASLLARAFQLTLSRQLIRDHPWLPTTAVSVTVRKSLVSDSPFENGEVDVDGELSMALPIHDDFLYGDLAYTSFGSDHMLGVPLESHQYVGMLGYEWTLREHSAIIGQYLYSEGVVKNLGDLSLPSHELYLGYKRRSAATTWEFGIIENLAPYNNSPDFGFSLGLIHDL